MKKGRKGQSTMAAASCRRRCETIPQDLVTVILSWLPVSSLLRFKSVSKSWLSLIQIQHFISCHFRKSDSDNLVVLFKPPEHKYYSFIFRFLSLNDLQLSKGIEFVPTYDGCEKCREELIASFNGIICFKYDILRSQVIDAVSLWNPATQQLTMLPPWRPDIEKHTDTVLSFEYGFGLGDRPNDYKVVRVIIESRELGYTRIKKQIKKQTEVYSLSTDSWSVIGAVPPLSFSVTCNPKKPLRNGLYCWLGYDSISQDYSILSFSFSNETFEIIPLPKVYSYDSECRLSLAFFREKIACFDQVNKQCNIWVLDEYAVKESWTNLRTVTFGRVYSPIGFSMDEKIILMDGSKRRICLYDPLTKEINDVPIQKSSAAAVYKESLVSVETADYEPDRVTCEVRYQPKLDSMLQYPPPSKSRWTSK